MSLILSGDRHLAGIYNYKNIYEITASSFNQRTFNTIEKDNLRVGELVNKNNFGIIELDKTNMQGVGSAVTYAKRYGLLSLSGMEPDENPDDDDGNKASGTKPKKSSNEQKPKTSPETPPVSSGNNDDGLDL